MKKVSICDITMRTQKDALSFREKIRLSVLSDKLGVDVIETCPITDKKADGLLIKSLSTAVKNAVISVPVPFDFEDGVPFVCDCLKEAKRFRLKVALPVSTVQMEYLYHKKDDAMTELVATRVSACAKVSEDVEFSALDAGRADKKFLLDVIDKAIESGATLITVCDTAGVMLPDEIASFVSSVKGRIDNRAKLSVEVSDELHLSQALALEALKAGADEIKVSSLFDRTVSLERFADLLKARGESLDVSSSIRFTEVKRTSQEIARLVKPDRTLTAPKERADEENEFTLTVRDSAEEVEKAAAKLGYDLSKDDVLRVYESFKAVALKKENVSAKELDALIATNALQVPPSYKLESYLVNSGNIISSSSHIRLTKDGESKEGICVGDGPIDASFRAIEQITGTHYELDDFRIRAVTEGREAMGETVVRLRHEGKLYAGRGISTDVVGSSILAYVNALNKIVYEEENK